MAYRYGHDWNVRRRHPVDEVDEATARRRFDEGPQVAVSRLDDGGSVPVYTLILGPRGGHVRVRRYDANGSVVETYDYSEVDGEDRLFLDNYKRWVYADGATGPQRFSQCVAHTSWVFRLDGTATCREVVKGLPEARVSEYRDVDVSRHWRDRPAFGAWDPFGEHPEPSRPT